jgi:hypothetical protein
MLTLCGLSLARGVGHARRDRYCCGRASLWLVATPPSLARVSAAHGAVVNANVPAAVSFVFDSTPLPTACKSVKHERALLVVLYHYMVPNQQT